MKNVLRRLINRNRPPEHFHLKLTFYGIGNAEDLGSRCPMVNAGSGRHISFYMFWFFQTIGVGSEGTASRPVPVPDEKCGRSFG